MLSLLAFMAAFVVAGALFVLRRSSTAAQPRVVKGGPPDGALVLVTTCERRHPSTSTAAPLLRPVQPPSLLLLYQQLCRAVAAERQSGYTVNCRQPAESFARLDGAVRSLVRSYIDSGAQDWKAYELYNAHHYVRHLVEENSDFELMLICWGPGQGSRVHNHASSHCWLTVLSGEVCEEQYQPLAAPAEAHGDLRNQHGGAAAPALPGVISACSPCPTLLHTATRVVPIGATAYINDLQALHAVRCAEQCPAPGAVTLHLYAPPIRRVRLYEQDNNRVVERQPGFFTVRGKKVCS